MNFYFTRDDSSAAKANSSSRISPHEFHAVKITQAYWSVSQNGAKFIALNFINAQNETADEIKIYYESNQGERLSGYHQINAILAFNNIQGLSNSQGIYKAYDFEAGGVVDKQGLVANELVGAYVGIILSENYYQGKNGIKHNLNLSAVYHYQTKQNAKQFLNNTPIVDGQIEQSIAYAQKSSETSKQTAERSQQPQGYAPQAPHGYPQGMTPSPSTSMQRPPQDAADGAGVKDDDIPF
ncbi:hypothetical protein LU293_04410 [Moraxella nasovis]|uniref:hypothetical protein n=1 Tax=Moraxella nasovis TaxID=2904121 RepID=UPI001F615CE6|nr:hypothetical protein [Moraxella nasovis]UNU74145.1 hypothetical protein LU293_04410 [Moraxella nasovis]